MKLCMRSRAFYSLFLLIVQLDFSVEVTSLQSQCNHGPSINLCRVFVYPVRQYDKHHSLLPKVCTVIYYYSDEHHMTHHPPLQSDEDQLLSERKSVQAVNNFT